eukprot:6198488-Pleurochrysis_carterae.AAC.1
MLAAAQPLSPHEGVLSILVGAKGSLVAAEGLCYLQSCSPPLPRLCTLIAARSASMCRPALLRLTFTETAPAPRPITNLPGAY